MKKILFTVLFLSSTLCFAQGTGDVGKIALSVIIPDILTELDATQKTRVETKITQIVTAAGLAASGYDQSFVIYPKFAVNEVDVVETGMQNLTKVTAELSLFIKQAETNVLFASTSKMLTGTGKTKGDAISNAIQKLPNKDAELTAFIEAGKQKIVQYYAEKCGDIIKKADALVNRQQYEEAIFELLAVPEECSDCYAKVSVKATAAFDAYQEKICEEQMQLAKTTFAAKNYMATLAVLTKINPGSNCFAQSQDMIMLVINQQCAEQLQIAKAKAGGGDFDGALKALESVNPGAQCYAEAVQLLSSISSKIAAPQKAAWESKVQKYNETKTEEKRDFEVVQQAKQSEQEIKPASKGIIPAIKEIAIGFFKRNKKGEGGILTRTKITF